MIMDPFETVVSNFFDKPKPPRRLRSKPSNILQYTFQRQITAKKIRPKTLFTPFVKRLELKDKLEGHYGCINTLMWSDSGEHLVSGSDDCMVNIWNISTHQLMTTYHSGHMGNILSAIFVSPMKTIATCGADACLRISDVETQTSYTLWDAKGWNRMFKVKYQPNDPHIVYSACSDGTVRLHDMRLRSTEEATLVVDHRNHKMIFGRSCGRTAVGVYDVSFHPWLKHQIATAGEDPYIRVYDIRKTNPNPIHVYCPLKLHHLSDDKRNELSVTSVTHNKNGSRLLATYIGDKIYSFEYQDRLHVGLLNKPEDYQNYQMEYSGHINQQTIKEVNYFGDEEFVVSGSDDGYIYIWETSTAHLLRKLRGDNDIVNVVQGHPYGYPILVSSGFESNIKIWEPGDEIINHNTTKEDCVLF